MLNLCGLLCFRLYNAGMSVSLAKCKGHVDSSKGGGMAKNNFPHSQILMLTATFVAGGIQVRGGSSSLFSLSKMSAHGNYSMLAIKGLSRYMKGTALPALPLNIGIEHKL